MRHFVNERMNNVYLCIQDYHLIKELIEFEDKQNDFQIVGITTSFHEDIEQFLKLEADVIVLQLGSDSLLSSTILSKIFTDQRLLHMQVLLLFRELDTNSVHLLLQYDIKNFLVEPFTCSQLFKAIKQESRNKKIESATNWNIEAFVTNILHEMGIPIHVKGYQYLITCATLVYQGCIGKRMVTGDIYAQCARIHETTATRIEKAIRTAVNYAYRTQPEKICIYNSKPTNSQLILYISEKLKLFQLL